MPGPKGEAEKFSLRCDPWPAEGDEVVPGLAVMEMHGSKTPGELAPVLEGATVTTGDLIRSRAAGSRCLLLADIVTDKQPALGSAQPILRDNGRSGTSPWHQQEPGRPY